MAFRLIGVAGQSHEMFGAADGLCRAWFGGARTYMEIIDNPVVWDKADCGLATDLNASDGFSSQALPSSGHGAEPDKRNVNDEGRVHQGIERREAD